MGHRLEVYLPEKFADHIIRTSSKFNIDAKVVGRVEKGETKKLTIKSSKGIFEY